MTEADFKQTQLEDRLLIEGFFNAYPSRSCERTFVNLYLWSRAYPVKWAVLHGALVLKSEDETHVSFAFPAGDDEAIRKAMAEMKAYCEEKGYPFTMYNLTPEHFETLERIAPGRFEIEYKRDYADYLYESEKLATLAGKKLHGKRNHINKFKTLYDGRWSYEPITKDNLEDCFAMAMEWRNRNDVEYDREKRTEMGVTMNALRLFEELDLTGGLLRLDGEVIAFTLGERLCDDTFVVHIEKAFAEIEGAYPMINQQFVQHACTQFTYINREEDAGVEGLRKAKLSYRPAALVEKGRVKEKE